VTDFETTATASPPLWVRVYRTFVEPARLGDDLAAYPRWGAAMLLGAALVTLSSLLIPAEIWQEMMREQLLASGREAPEGAAEIGATVFRIWAVGGGLVFWALWSFALAGLVTLLFAFILGDDGRYRQYLALTTHALLIAALGALLTVPLKIAQGSPQLTLSIGTFFPIEAGYLARFLRGLDLFALWSYVVLAIGVSRVDRSRSVASAAVILLVFAVAITALFALIPSPV
jgi:hypothetical protein